MLRVLLVGAVVFVGCAADAASPRITTEKLGADHWRLTVTLPSSTDLAAGQAQLVGKARELCAPEDARFGRYRFESEQRVDARGRVAPGGLTFIQDVDCGSAAAEPPAENPGAVAERTDAAIVDLTERFLASLGEGDPRVSYDLAARGLHGDMTPDEWAALVSTDRARAGKSTSRRVAKVTWYDNPPQAPEPGLYAAADYEATAENLHFECGYVIWFLGPDGRWRAVRHELRFLSKADVPDPSPAKLAEYRGLLRCVN